MFKKEFLRLYGVCCDIVQFIFCILIVMITSYKEESKLFI